VTRISLITALAAGLVLSVSAASRGREEASLLARVDHLVYATPDLTATVDAVDRLLGIHAVAGGQHLGRGTRNALIALGPTSYLEIIGPDPDQPAPVNPRPFGIDGLQRAKLAAWASKTADVPAVVRDAAVHGIVVGQPTPGSRRRPDGVELTWEYTDPRVVVGDGLVPFFINWGRSPHPSRTAAPGATLRDFRAEHPRPEKIQGMLAALHLDLPVTRGTAPALIATIEGRHGRVDLR
jgi:Glyoxalase-like domain